MASKCKKCGGQFEWEDDSPGKHKYNKFGKYAQYEPGTNNFHKCVEQPTTTTQAQQYQKKNKKVF
jgi:hypothetical protein